MAVDDFDDELYSLGLKTSLIPANLHAPPAFDLSKAVPVEIEQTYEGLKDSVKCAYGHRHKNGAIVVFDGGDKHLLGKNCAEKHFKTAWPEILKNHEAIKDRRLHDSVVAPALARVARLKAGLEQLEDVARQKDAFFTHIEVCRPEFYEQLLAVRHNGGVWYKGSTSKAGIAGNIIGAHAISLDASDRLQRCFRSLDKAHAHYSVVPANKKDQIEGEGYVSRVLKCTEELVPELRSCNHFFTKPAMQTLVAAANEDPSWRKRVSIVDDMLSLDVTGRFEFKNLPIPFGLPAAMSKLEEALDAVLKR